MFQHVSYRSKRRLTPLELAKEAEPAVLPKLGRTLLASECVALQLRLLEALHLHRCMRCLFLCSASVDAEKLRSAHYSFCRTVWSASHARLAPARCQSRRRVPGFTHHRTRCLALRVECASQFKISSGDLQWLNDAQVWECTALRF